MPPLLASRFAPLLFANLFAPHLTYYAVIRIACAVSLAASCIELCLALFLLRFFLGHIFRLCAAFCAVSLFVSCAASCVASSFYSWRIFHGFLYTVLRLASRLAPLLSLLPRARLAPRLALRITIVSCRPTVPRLEPHFCLFVHRFLRCVLGEILGENRTPWIRAVFFHTARKIHEQRLYVLTRSTQT